MDASNFRALPIAVAVVGLAFSECVAAPAVPSAPEGPFARIPALTTSCYRERDPFAAKLEAAEAAVAKDRESQEAINARIEDDFNKLDMMEKSQRMTQWMMDHPQDAAKYMQANQAVGTGMQTASPELANEEKKFNDGYKDLVDRYNAAMKQARAPADARMAALNKKLADFGCSLGSGECTLPDYAQPELEAVLRMADAAYQAACPQWWGAKGEIPAYLKRHRDWLVTKYLPTYGQIDDIRVQQFAIMNTPAASYKSTLPHEKASPYIKEIGKLYQMRPDKPYCTSVGCEGFLPAISAVDTGTP
jgi:hypothetical protein